MRAAFPDKPYLSLEDPDVVRLAAPSPGALLDGYRDGLILDEAQAVPELFSFLKTAVDRNPGPGRYNRHRFPAVQSGRRRGRIPRRPSSPGTPSRPSSGGLYPTLSDRDVSAAAWYGNYLGSYVERDVRSLLNVKDLGQFQTFLRLCASPCSSRLSCPNSSKPGRTIDSPFSLGCPPTIGSETPRISHAQRL